MKNVLLIGGGGTLGTPTAKELLRLGYNVDVTTLDDQISDNPNLTFYKMSVISLEALNSLFRKKHYDGIINFLHYTHIEGYIPIHELLTQNTQHLIFLSSYRVYADLQHPITETAPQLIDVIKDNPQFHKNEIYALAKSRAERYLHNNNCPKIWTIVRPVISFSERRFDINMVSGHVVIDAAKSGTAVQLPIEAKNLTAGLDWAGNSGKLIANLLFKNECMGEAYTVSSAQNLTWGEIADIYTKYLNVKFEWIPANYPKDEYGWYYDRAYDRKIDNTKILKATALERKDFKNIDEGIYIELKKHGAIK